MPSPNQVSAGCFTLEKQVTRRPTIDIFFVMIASAAIGACSTIPRIDAGGYSNQPADQKTHAVARASFPSCSDSPMYAWTKSVTECDSKLFLGIAISGGGSRAANFGIGALWELQQLGILDHATALSSVSGGSLAATYVALYGLDSRTKFDAAAEAMRQDFFAAWALRSMNPYRVLRVNTTHDSATNTLADTFDSLLFHGQTFSNLGPFSPGRPYLYINASLQNLVTARKDLTTRGDNAPSGSLQGFTFTQSAFREIGSDLEDYRLADAVASSGAYPGLFEPMVLRNYLDDSLPGDPPDTYLHLADGGLADNLGVDALLRALQETRNSILNPEQEPQACLLILVDAAVQTPLENAGAKEDLRVSPLNSVVSSSLKRGYDILLDRRREDQLSRLGLNVSSDTAVRFNPSVDVPFGNYSYVDLGTSKSRVRGPNISQFGPHGVTSHTTCAVWHISFDHLAEIAGFNNRFQRENYGPWTQLPDPLNDGIEGSTKKIDHFINSIGTNYKLVLDRGNRCSAKDVQHAIFDAASILVRSDDATLKLLSGWLRANHETSLALSVERGEEPLSEPKSMRGVSVTQGEGGVILGGPTCHANR
jgi:predicted acylesterase/phospholipase RssA